MKNLIYIFIGLLLVAFIANYVYSEFTLGNQLILSAMKVDENYYLGYGFHWRGLIKPRLVNVRLRNKDGSLIDQYHDQVEVTPLIDVRKGTGSLDEEMFLELSGQGTIEYIPVKDAVFENNNWLLLVLRVKLKDEKYENTIETMVLDYRIFGIPKRQLIDYEGFLNSPMSSPALPQQLR